jgi:hypothetical protein
MGDSATLKQELDGLVAIYLSQGQTAEAEAALRRMREIDPADLTLPERLGRARSKSKDAAMKPATSIMKPRSATASKRKRRWPARCSCA